MTIRTRSRHSLKRPLRPNEVSLTPESSTDQWLVVHLHLDVCDAMGANAASTVAEGVAPTLAALTEGRVGLRIVSNLCTMRLAKVRLIQPIFDPVILLRVAYINHIANQQRVLILTRPTSDALSTVLVTSPSLGSKLLRVSLKQPHGLKTIRTVPLRTTRVS
jgi:hypothetical protein